MTRSAWTAGVAVLAIAVTMLIPGRDTNAACPAGPISREALNAAIGLPVTAFAEPDPRDDLAPVDAGRVRRIVEFVIDLDNCARTGEPLRVWSLYSPAYLNRLFRIQGPFDEATYAAYADTATSEDQGPTVQSFERIWVAGEGLYGVEAIKTYPSVPIPKRLIFWIAETDQGFRIEEITGEISFSLP
jgi:hypothetical protein